MNDVYTSAEFQSLHTLQRRIGTSRHADEHPYQPVTAGLSTLARPREHRRRPHLHVRADHERH